MTVKELKDILKKYRDNQIIKVDSYGEMTRSDILSVCTSNFDEQSRTCPEIIILEID